MSSKLKSLLVVTAVLVSSCGLLGPKDDLDKMLKFVNEYTGCLNDFGDNVDRYLIGEISAKQWEYNWDCVGETLKVFKRFVRQGDERGYTQEDFSALFSNFLVTDKEIRPEMIDSAFRLKTSIFGGNPNFLTKTELDGVIRAMKTLRIETTSLIPHLWNKQNDPSPEKMLEFSTALEVAGANIGIELDTVGNPSYQERDLDTFIMESSSLYDLGFPEGTAQAALHAKGLLLGRESSEIKDDEWAKVFEVGSALAGIIIAANSVDFGKANRPNAEGNYLHYLILRGLVHLKYAVSQNGGFISFDTIEKAVESIPDKWFDLEQRAFSKAMRATVTKLFGSQVDGIDNATLDRMLALYEEWNTTQTHIEGIFESQGLSEEGVIDEDFVHGVAAYRASVPDNEAYHIDRIIRLHTDFKPIYIGSQQIVEFQHHTLLSMNQLSELNWMDLTSRKVMRGYAISGEGRNLTEDELLEFFRDYRELAYELDILDPTVPGIHERRFRDADLFTLGSNGDGFLQQNEITNYIPYAVSIGNITTEIREDAEMACSCAPSPENPMGFECQDILVSIVDPSGWRWMDAECFREKFFGNMSTYWRAFPELVEFYSSLSNEQKLDVEHNMEQGARRYGYSHIPVGSFDAANMMGIIHYVESLFFRFDTDRNRSLDLDETLVAEELFKRVVAEVGDIDIENDFMLEAVFTFLVDKGRAPSDGIGGFFEIAWWIAQKPFWSIDANRNDIFKVTGFFNASEDPPEEWNGGWGNVQSHELGEIQVTQSAEFPH